MMSDVCKHCITAPCQQACPTGAIIYNEFGNVYIQPDICNGCSYCIAACPFGVITRSDENDGHAHKCTLCYNRQKDGLVPACAKACPTQSIQFGPIEELRKRAANESRNFIGAGVTTAYLYGEEATETYSGLHSFYLLIDTPATYGLPEKPVNPWLHMKEITFGQSRVRFWDSRRFWGHSCWEGRELKIPPSRKTIHAGCADREVVKTPGWHSLVVWDVFFNGLTTGLFLVAALAELVLPTQFKSICLYAYPVALMLLLIDLVLLVLDLGDPWRFHHMLRVFKPSSPMSLGTWCLTIYSGSL